MCGPVVQWLVQRFWSERFRVRSRRSATFTPSAHVRRQSLPVWPISLYLYNSEDVKWTKKLSIFLKVLLSKVRDGAAGSLFHFKPFLETCVFFQPSVNIPQFPIDDSRSEMRLDNAKNVFAETGPTREAVVGAVEALEDIISVPSTSPKVISTAIGSQTLMDCIFFSENWPLLSLMFSYSFMITAFHCRHMSGRDKVVRVYFPN